MIKLNPNIIKENALKKDNMIILILVGILLLVIAWPMEEYGEKEKTEQVYGLWDKNDDRLTETNKKSDVSEQEEKTYISYSFQEEEYIVQALERRLEDILYVMQGVGEVKVMITLASQGEKIVEKDVPLDRSNILEEDSTGGTRSTNEMNSKEETVYSTNAQGDKVPYVIKETGVEVLGVSVVAQGGDNDIVQKNISETIQALFGIEEHKIKVVKMKYQE